METEILNEIQKPVIIRELQVKYKSRRRVKSARMDCPKAIWEFCCPLIGDNVQESMLALYLDNKNTLIGYTVVSTDTVSETIVHPRECFLAGISMAAAGLVLAHNHPSGSLQPSKEDILTTTRIMEAGKILGVPLLDHVIISSEGFFSMKEAGHL